MHKAKWYAKPLYAMMVLALAAGLILVPAAPASAAHTATVTPAVTTCKGGVDVTVTVTVTNAGADNITKVEIDLPPEGDGVSSWTGTEIVDPDGDGPWVAEYELDKYGTKWNKLIWTGGSLGIASEDFTFTATAPIDEMPYVFRVSTTDDAAPAVTEVNPFTIEVDSTPPAVLSAAFTDTTTLTVVFGETLDTETVASEDFTDGKVVGGTFEVTDVSFKTTSVTDDTVVATISDISEYGTDATGSVDISGISDPVGNEMLVDDDQAIDDGQNPEAVSAAFTGGTSLEVVFSEVVDIDTVDTTDFTNGKWGAAGTFTVDSVTTSSDSDTIDLVITPTEGFGTDATGTVDIDTIDDLAGNTIDTVMNQPIDDGQAPEFASAVTGDTDHNGHIDQLEVTFSEDLDNGCDFTGTGFSLSDGYTISTGEESTAGVITFTLAESGAFDTGVIPTLSYDDAVGDITDAAETPNALASFSDEASTDKAEPILLTILWRDMGGLGTLTENDTLMFTFSEAMDNTTIDNTNINERLLTSEGSSYGSVTSEDLVWSASDTVLTVTLGAGTDIGTDETVNPADEVTDAEANPDATAEPGPGIDLVVTTVSIDNPANVAPGEEFDASVVIEDVTNFDAASYQVTFTSDILELKDITAGTIGETSIPVSWSQTDGTATIAQNVPETGGASGSGTLAILHFKFVGSSGTSSSIGLATGILSDTSANRIYASWVGSEVSAPSATPGDVNGDGTIDAVDIGYIELVVAGISEAPGNADANEDGLVNALDITKIELLVAGY